MAVKGRGERGNVGIWGVLAFTAVGAFMALSIHAGRQYSNRGELQNGADAAALAAAARLDGTPGGIDGAQAAAQAFGQAHFTENEQIAIDPAADVEFGSWDLATHTFTPIAGRTDGDLRKIVAVRVRDARLDLPVQFGPAFLSASTRTTVGSSAVAAGGGPCGEKCAFPAAFADCMLVNADGSLKCDDRFYVLNNDWQDNLGLTSLDPTQSASVPNIKDALKSCVKTSANEQIPVSNGNPIQPVFGSWPSPPDSFPLEVVSPVVHADNCQTAHYETCVGSGSGANSVCTNAKFVGDMPIVGYASFVICYITGSVVKAWPPPDWGVATSDAQQALWNECGPAPTQADFAGVPDAQWPDPFLKQTIFIKHRCHYEDPGPAPAGCESFGIWMTRSRLVQ